MKTIMTGNVKPAFAEMNIKAIKRRMNAVK